VIGLLPITSNSTATVMSVSATAISGEAMAMSAERSARRSSTNCMLRLLLALGGIGGGAAHQQPQRFPRCFGSGQRRRKLPATHHRDAIGDLCDFVEVLTDDQHSGA